MSAIDTFLNEVRPWASGVPDATAYKGIRQAAQEFCERTRLWKHEDDYDITDDGTEAIFTPNGSILHDIEVVLFNDHPLTPATPRDVDRYCPGWRTGSLGTGLPQYVTQIDQNGIRIVPSMAGHIYLCVRLKPSMDAMDLPDFMASEYRECIGWGALGRILMLPGQPYSNPELATFYMQRFSNKLDSLSTKGTTGQQNATKRTKASFF